MINSAENKIPSKLKKFLNSQNICEFLDEQQLQKIGYSVCNGAETDETSRQEWSRQLEEALKIAKQVGDLDNNVADRKTLPFEGAANIKYPLMLNACIQFNARVNPEIVQGDKVVYMDVMREDPQGQFEEIGKRLTAHMSYQLLGKSDHWREDTDRLLIILPMVGTVFRKSFWNDLKGMPDFELCLPDDIIVNNKARSLETAFRVTHKLYLSDNDLLERMRSDLYTDIDLDELGNDISNDEYSNVNEDGLCPYATRRMYELYEQHTFLDLDDDGYKEPYIVVVHKQSQKVLRIIARFKEQQVKTNSRGEIIRIEAKNYFTDYHFIPSPDGNFYSMGFGMLLYPMNTIINKALNNLLDAGSLCNMQAGFVGKGLRVKNESLRFVMGEYKKVECQDGTSLKDNFFPLPVRDPSPIVLQLVELMIKASQETANISDVMQGQTPGANTPATTVLSLIEQGTKVFSSILYRLYQAFKKEFEKLYEMNKEYFDTAEFYKHSLGVAMIQPSDYKFDDFAIMPVADPATSTEAQRLGRAQALWQLMSAPGVDQREIIKRWLDAIKAPNPEKVLPEPDPNAPPPPEVLKLMAEIKKINSETGMLVAEGTLKAIDRELAQRRLKLDAELAVGALATGKIDSIVKIAQAEQMGEPVQQAKQFEQGEETEAQQQAPDDTQPIAQQLGMMTGQIQPLQQQQLQGNQIQPPQGQQLPMEEQLMQGAQGQGGAESQNAPPNPELAVMQASSPDTTGITGVSKQMQGVANAKQQQAAQAGS